MIPIPKELLEQVERGNALLFIGERIVRDVEGRAVIDLLAAQLAERSDIADKVVAFPDVAQAYEDDHSTHALVQFMRDQLDALGDAPQRVHRLIARLTDCDVLVTTSLDRRLERAFEESGRPLDVIIGNPDVAFEDERKTQLYKLRGSIERPESLVLTEDDYETFFEGQASISVVLQAYLARKTILFVGYDLTDPHFKRLYRKVTAPLDDYARRAYAFGETPSPGVSRWCKRRGIDLIEADATAFLEALTEQLAARARPPLAVPPRPVEEPPTPLPERPYKLLDYYEAKDAAIFFGRRAETQTLSSLIHAHRLVLLYGASGTGKTSLLLAGAAPQLERAEPPYETIHVRALDDPALVIRRTIRRRWPEADLPEDGSLVDFLDAATKALGRTLVIILDQFEEFFIRLSRQFRQAFVDELGALYDAHDVPVKVVISLREDWLAAVNEIRMRIPEVFYIDLRLLPLTREQARQAITAPVEQMGVSYEPALVEQLLDDLAGGEGAGVMPPQLQLVCSELYGGLESGEGVISLSAYERLGGARGVLQKYLADELARLESDERALARGVLEELVTSRGTKSVKAGDELALALGAGVSDINPVLEKLVRARLLRVLEDEGGEMAYELAHEYLIREIGLSAEAQARKQAEELLKQEVENWDRLGLLIEGDRFGLLNAHRDELHFTPEHAAFMLRCAIRHNSEIEYWAKTLNVQDATRIVGNTVNEEEDWVKPADHINALQAAIYLPPEVCEPWLCERALAEDNLLAQKARSLLRGQGRESAVTHFYALWISGNQDQRKGAIRVLAELDSPAATEALGKILRSQPPETRIELIEIIGQAPPTDAQRLVAQAAICYGSVAVREKAWQCLHRPLDIDIAQQVFEWCVPRYQNHTQYLREVWSNVSRNISAIRDDLRIMSKWFESTAQIRVIEQEGDTISYRPDPSQRTLRHNRALLVACVFLGESPIDSLVEIIEAELQHRPGIRERLSGWLFLIPLLFWLLVIPSPLRFLARLRFLGFVVLPLTILTTLLIAHWENIRAQDKTLAILPQQIRDLFSRDKNYNFLLAQSIPLFLALVIWLLDITVPFVSGDFVTVKALRVIIILVRLVAWALYFAIVVSVCYYVGVERKGSRIRWSPHLNRSYNIKRNSKRNITWFIAGPGKSIRWHTAIELLWRLDRNVLLASLERFASQPDRTFPMKVTRRIMSHRIGTSVKLKSDSEEILKDVFRTTHDPETWYIAGTMLKKNHGELVEQIAWKEMRNLGSGFRAKAVTLLKSRESVFARLFMSVRQVTQTLLAWGCWLSILVSLIGCCIWVVPFTIFNINPLSPPKAIWTLHLGKSNPNILWVSGGTGLYRMTLDGEKLIPSADLLLKDLAVKAMACSPEEDACFVTTSDRRVGIIAKNTVEWLDFPDLKSEIEVMWVTQNGKGALHLWIQAGWKLFVSTDIGNTWNEPFDKQIVTQFKPIDEHRALLVVGQAKSKPSRPIVYATNNSGEAWEETQYTWLETEVDVANTSKQHSPSPSSRSVDYYVFSTPNQSIVFLAGSSANELWYSAQGLVWQQVFSAEESLGQRACGAWFQPPKAQAYGETVLLYRSYALLDGEQGIYLSRDHGQTWKRILINQAAPAPLRRWHPQCGDAWPWQ